MHKALLYSTVALGLLSAGAAFGQAGDAQQQTSPQQPAKGASAPDHTTPPPPQAQPQAPLADQAKPAAIGPAQANTADKLNGPKDFATPQTMPSTLSADNAKLDKLPITALQLPLTDDQKKKIADGLSSAKGQNSAELGNVHVAGYLPPEVTLREFSPEMTQQLPLLGRYKFVKADQRVLIVDPPNLVVVGEIPQSGGTTGATTR